MLEDWRSVWAPGAETRDAFRKMEQQLERDVPEPFGRPKLESEEIQQRAVMGLAGPPARPKPKPKE